MAAVFADTSYWLALTLVRDPYRQAALTAGSHHQAELVVTTADVLVEFLNALSARPEHRRLALAALDRIQADELTEVVPQSQQLFDAGVEFYRQRPDKGHSLTDCISMVTMRRLGITDALTTDRHFEQEGFAALLRQVT